MRKGNEAVKVTLDYCKGSNEGRAIYLNIEGEGGRRVAGPKCWGYINPIESFEMDENDLKDLIKYAQKYLSLLRRKFSKGKRP